MLIMLKFPLRFIGLLIGILIGVVGCSSDLSDNQVLTLRLGAEPSMLNPILSTDSPSSSVNGYVFSGLLKVTPELELEPDLAESYTVSADGLVYLFNLKQNIKWHDGEAFTAHDVKYTYDMILNPSTNTVRRSDYIIDGKAVEFKVLDEYTLQIRMHKPYAPLLNRLTMGIIPEHIFEVTDINTAKENQNPIGTGPYKFKQWETSQFVLLEANEAYYDEPPKIKKIIMKIIPDNNTALISFEKEEILSSGIPGKDFKRIAKNDLFNTYRYYDLAYTYLGLNCKHPLFSNKNVRKALAMSIDKRSIVDGILLGYGKPAHIPTSPEMWTYPKKPFFYDYNKKEALKIFAEEGYIFDKEKNILSKDDKPVTFKIITNKGNKDRELAATLIQKNLKEIGIEVSIQLMEWSSFIAIVNEHVDPKKFDAVILGWSLGLDPDAYSLWHSREYPKGFNFVGYSNSDVDDFLVMGRKELDREERKMIYEKMYEEIAKDVPYIFLYYPESLVGLNKIIQGVSPAGPAGLLNPIENIYLIEK